tara:strand:+ start:313 stop:810 length:498 start_codon:yes stop_codon:yes gene_type:complete
MAINTATGGTGTIINTAYQYRLNSGATYSSGNILNQNWEATDVFGTQIGTGFSESGGVWTFPCTGKWHIQFQMTGFKNGNAQYYGIQIKMTSDGGSNYHTVGSCYTWGASGTNNHVATFQDVLVSVPNTSNYKMKFNCDFNADLYLFGSTSQQLTGFTAIRLGDA